MWVLNSCALNALGERSLASAPAGLEKIDGEITGRLYECDRWLREQLNSQLPCLDKVSQLLASYGITGVTDTTPHNGGDEWQFFKQAGQRGELLQQVRMMGTHALNECVSTDLIIQAKGISPVVSSK